MADPDQAVKELYEQLDQLQRDVASALTRWPNDPELQNLAVMLDLK